MEINEAIKKLSRVDFLNEEEGQYNFFDAFGITNDVVLSHSTDGVINSTILEFKLNFTTEGKVLSQVINYLAKIRIAGEPVPGKILLVDLLAHRAYYIGSRHFGKYIDAGPKSGPSSILNYINGIDLSQYHELIDFTTTAGYNRIKEILATKNAYYKVKVDGSNVLGLASYYYNLDVKAKKKTKGSFWTKDTTVDCELRKPDILEDMIQPYTGDGVEFNGIMDLLNPTYLQKKLGAFYTPSTYASITAKWVMEAVDAAMKENNEDGTRKYDDFIILDRCAGTGNLEAELDSYYLSHCVVGTIELQEWYHLYARLGDQVQATIPADIKKATISVDGLIKEADACSEEYYKYLKNTFDWDNPRLFKVVLENPPYADLHGSGNTKQAKGITKQQTWMVSKMNANDAGWESNDLANQFIWSCQTMLKPHCYIVYSPAKYWSISGLMLSEYTPKNTFLANKKVFHASPSGICVINWVKQSSNIDKLSFNAIDHLTGKKLDRIEIKKAGITVDKGWKSGIALQEVNDIWCSSLDGTLRSAFDESVTVKPKTAKNMVGCMRMGGTLFGPLYTNLVVKQMYCTSHRNIYDDNALENLPFFVTTLYESVGKPAWYHIGVHTRGAGDTAKWRKDKQFLYKCFIYSCLTHYAHGRSVKDDKGNVICLNNLCFDKNTWASMQYEKIKAEIEDTELIKLKKEFDNILELAKKSSYTYTVKDEEVVHAPYDKDLKYNLYQIDKEINCKIDNLDADGKQQFDKAGKVLQITPFKDLNDAIVKYKKELQKYYQEKIVPDLFKYELIR